MPFIDDTPDPAGTWIPADVPLNLNAADIMMEEFPELTEDTDWENNSDASTVVEDNDYGVPYVAPQPAQPANPSNHLANGFWLGPDSDEEVSDGEAGPVNDNTVPPASPGSSDAGTVNDENVPPPNHVGTGAPWVSQDEPTYEAAELSITSVSSMAVDLGVADSAAFLRFARDERIFELVSWLVQKDFGHSVDLVNFTGWKLARCIFLVGGNNNFDIFVQYYGNARHPDGSDSTASAISTAFENMEDVRRGMRIEPWGTMSMKWRVCYAVLQLYLSAGTETDYGLATMNVGDENRNEENRERMEEVFGAVRAYADVLREEGEYDTEVPQN